VVGQEVSAERSADAAETAADDDELTGFERCASIAELRRTEPRHEPLTLAVNAQSGPVFTDPNATVAWSGGLSPEVVANLSFGALLGRGSGESIQLKFQGEGWVVVQPYEEVYFQQAR
jgi:hypothetical protein